MTYNKKFWIISLLITTFDMSKVLVLFSQVWYPPWLILMFSVRPKPVSIGPPIPKKWWHILKNANFEVLCLFSMIFLGTSDSDKLPWKLCKHHFPKLECQWVALEANSWWWSFILSIRLRQKSDVVWIFDEFSFRLVNIVAHDYSNDSVSVMSMPSCVFSMPLDEENMLVDVCGQKLAVLYFKNWIGNKFLVGFLFVNWAFGNQNHNITIVEGQYVFHVNCTLGCEQKRVLIDRKSTIAIFHSTKVSICKVSFSLV